MSGTKDKQLWRFQSDCKTYSNPRCGPTSSGHFYFNMSSTCRGCFSPADTPQHLPGRLPVLRERNACQEAAAGELGVGALRGLRPANKGEVDVVAILSTHPFATGTVNYTYLGCRRGPRVHDRGFGHLFSNIFCFYLAPWRARPGRLRWALRPCCCFRVVAAGAGLIYSPVCTLVFKRLSSWSMHCAYSTQPRRAWKYN